MQTQPFSDPLSQPTMAAHAAPDEVTREQWEKACRSGANWFYWIAALSLVNTVIFFLGVERTFIIGLALTQIVDGVFAEVAKEAGGAAYAIGFIFNAFVIGGVALFGLLANRRKTWAFALGMVLYALDGAVFLLIEEWGGLAFHVFVLYCLAVGWSAAVKCNRNPAPASAMSFSAPAL